MDGHCRVHVESKFVLTGSLASRGNVTHLDACQDKRHGLRSRGPGIPGQNPDITNAFHEGRTRLHARVVVRSGCLEPLVPEEAVASNVLAKFPAPLAVANTRIHTERADHSAAVTALGEASGPRNALEGDILARAGGPGLLAHGGATVGRLA